MDSFSSDNISFYQFNSSISTDNVEELLVSQNVILSDIRQMTLITNIYTALISGLIIGIAILKVVLK